jgi:DNA-binding NtrC family response regulator
MASESLPAPGIDGYAECLAAADAEGSARECGTGDVQEALLRHRGNVTAAALELRVSRPTLYELMDKLGMARES